MYQIRQTKVWFGTFCFFNYFILKRRFSVSKSHSLYLLYLKSIKLEHFLRKALPSEAEIIWNILQQAIERRRKDGSRQWQDGYPNLEVVKMDISSGKGYILEREGKIAAYAALVFNDEPAYDEIEGNWLTHGDFLVIHRVAVSDDFLGKGIAVSLFKLLEDFAKEHHVFSIKVDTNFDNLVMLHILEKLNYQYCGEVYFRGGARKAFEKVLS